MTLPIRREESAYSIVSGAAIKRLCCFEVLYPTLFVIFGLVIRLLGYVKEAYQTFSAKELTMEVLDCSAILLSLFMNQSKTASNIMFMLDLGNHLDQWS